VSHTISLNQHWTTNETAEGLRHERHFGAPRLRDEKVYLSGLLAGQGTIEMNGESLGVFSEAFEVEITTKLKPRNQLIAFAQGLAEVFLVIR
jgi:hypothetical protein